MKKVLLFFGYTIPLTAAAQDPKGNAASFAAGNVPNWALSDPSNTGAVITPSADGLSATVSVPVASTTAGLVTVTVSGQGDANAGEDPISGTIELDVKAVEATQVVITAGTMIVNS